MFVNPRFAVLATAVLLATSLHTGQSGGDIPQPDRDSLQPPESSTSCDGLLDHQEALFAVFADHGDFVDYWTSATARDARGMDIDEATSILEDGQALVAGLTDLDVPEVYAQANEGIVAYFQFQVDYLTFIVVDTSSPPDLDLAQQSLVLMYEGEIATADACPDEVDEAGGYIWVDPDDLADAVGE